MTASTSGPTRRQFAAAALAASATPAFAGPARPSRLAWREDRDRFSEGVGSGDPQADSVILWTRCKPARDGAPPVLQVEVSEVAAFHRVIVRRTVKPAAAADWTCRVLVGGLRPSRPYWYRFIASDGSGSRIGRTRTAPGLGDPRPVAFAFVSCQNINLGPLTAWRRMLFDDERAPPEGRIGFVLHLGDFVYDTVWTATDHPEGYFDRKVRDAFSLPVGEKIDDIHVPVTLEDYRTLYRAYLADPDLQEARARWPFVAIWDNGEFSDKGWQGLQRFGDLTRPAQTRKVAANQAWFEYMPARVRSPGGSLESFAPPGVVDAPVLSFDAEGLGQEPNNRAAIDSLKGYRAHRWGPHVEILLTDQRSHRSEDYTAPPEAKAMASPTFPQMVPFEALEALDGGRAAQDGHPPPKLRFAERVVDNYRRESGPRTLLGKVQKAWFLDQLSRSTATWKVWGNTVATLDMRADPQHLPAGLTATWPGEGYAGFARTDHSTAYTERAEIYDVVAARGITGFVILSGDRHSFWAGLASKSLPPAAFQAVGAAFVTGSISSPGMVEALEHTLSKTHPLRSLYLIDRPDCDRPEPSVNLLLRHGVATCLDYAAHGDLERAKRLSDPGNAPHVAFVDMGGHGYSLVRASASDLQVEFVCIPRPIEPSPTSEGAPLRYRVAHKVDLWKRGQAPRLEATLLEGDVGLSG